MTSPTTTTGTAIDTSNEGVSPKTITKPPSCDDEGACAEGFLLDGAFIGLDCSPIKESAVTPVVIAAGRVAGEDVSVNVIDDVVPAVMMVVSLPGGGCTDDDPDERRSAWSLAVPDSTDHELLLEAVCRVGDLTEQRRLANGCDSSGAAGELSGGSGRVSARS